ncbi:MAG: hypothetical protein ACK5ND_04495 [Bacteroides sp.]
MNIEEIKRLLANFYEGETNEKEEEELKKIFEQGTIPAELEIEKRLFLSLKTPQKMTFPENLEQKLIDLIETKEQKDKAKTKRFTFWVSSIAASLLILLSVNYFLDQVEEVHPPKDTIRNPQEVCQILRSTLIDVSTELNNGVDEMVSNGKEIKRVNKEIKQEINK